MMRVIFPVLHTMLLYSLQKIMTRAYYRSVFKSTSIFQCFINLEKIAYTFPSF